MGFKSLGLLSYLPVLVAAATVSQVIFSGKRKETYIWFIVAGLVLDVGLWVIAGYTGNNLKPFSGTVRYLYPLLSLCVLFGTYYFAIERRYAIFFIIMYLCFAIIIVIHYLQFPAIPESFIQALNSSVAMFTSVVYFYLLILKLPSKHIYLHPFFWFNAGIFFYHGGWLWLTAVTQNWNAVTDTAHQLLDTLIAFIKQVAILICINLYLRPFKYR